MARDERETIIPGAPGRVRLINVGGDSIRRETEAAISAKEIELAEARGFRRAIEALRDEARYSRWCEDDMAVHPRTAYFWPNWHHAPRFADYLESLSDLSNN